MLRTLLRVILALNKCAWLVQKAEDGPYLVKFLLNGSNGTPLRDMLRSISRNLKHPTLSTKSSQVHLPHSFSRRISPFTGFSA